MASVMERTLRILELLSRAPGGLPVGGVAAALDMPASAAHRMLGELQSLGYVRQSRAQGDYALTLRLAAMGAAWMGRAGLCDIAQPVLDSLAAQSGELVRLSVAEGDRLTWIAVAQGAVNGLRYDPASEQGETVNLAHSASGRAWLSALPEEVALARAAAQGLAPPDGATPGSALRIEDLARILRDSRAQGHATACDSFLAGMAAVAVPVVTESGAAGALSIAGPSARLTPARMRALAPALAAAAGRLAELAAGSAWLRGQA
ncbi:transcriptional regulator, IclR family [Paracoccus aminovorans]|uniref:Transcriptional regulator, IclR family n=1 Tax=Paracoccus aminovorans TaxID=34004 RepID=A0A1I3AQQ1_9RHOB|nr:IclR family transcriptional regulator [Paracoccus aminovorans]CQR84333.1 Transcriptional regulator [Paracoccus aminovorans]SFH52397.1 transcriptional regulator, IclR family [Paracoccus aminovorans]